MFLLRIGSLSFPKKLNRGRCCMNFIVKPVAVLFFCLSLSFLSPNKSFSSNLYADVTNPVSWLVLSFSGGDRTSDMVSCSVGQYAAALVIAEGDAPERAVLADQSNFILELLSFGNEKSIKNLGIASGLGEHFFQYYIFASTVKRNENDYLPLELDAFSVLVYGYSWFVNIPAKIFTQVGVISELTKHEGMFVSLISYIDPIVNILSLAIEVPLALFNTIIGFVLAFIFHPIDSLCSMLPAFYFLIKTTLTAIINIF